jgi:hypothetical protein
MHVDDQSEAEGMMQFKIKTKTFEGKNVTVSVDAEDRATAQAAAEAAHSVSHLGSWRQPVEGEDPEKLVWVS